MTMFSLGAHVDPGARETLDIVDVVVVAVACGLIGGTRSSVSAVYEYAGALPRFLLGGKGGGLGISGNGFELLKFRTSIEIPILPDSSTPASASTKGAVPRFHSAICSGDMGVTPPSPSLPIGEDHCPLEYSGDGISVSRDSGGRDRACELDGPALAEVVREGYVGKTGDEGDTLLAVSVTEDGKNGSYTGSFTSLA